MIQKVASRSCVRGWVSPSDDRKTLYLSMGGKWIHFSNQGRIRELGMGSAFHQLCARYNGTQIPTAPTATRLWETFTFTDHIKC